MRFINKLKIRAKLNVMIGFALIAIICISGSSLRTTSQMGVLVNSIKEHPLVVSNLAADSQRLVLNILKTYQQGFIEKDFTKQSYFERKVHAYDEELDANMVKIQELILGDNGQLIAEETIEAINNWRTITDHLKDEIFDPDKREGARSFLAKDVIVETEKIQEKLSDIQSYAKHKAEEMNTQALEIEKRAQIATVVMGGAIASLMAFLTMGISNNILGALRTLRDTMEKSLMEEKFLKVELVGDDEVVDVGSHYNRLIGQLEDQFDLRNALNILSNAILGDLSLEALSSRALSVISEFTKSGNGVFYSYNDIDKSLDLVATYAFTAKQDHMHHIALGESLVGQVALDQKMILWDDVTENEGLINSGIISKVPVNIIGIPLIFENQLYGVIELASLSSFDSKRIDYLNNAAEIIAIRVYATIQKEAIHKLLENSKGTNLLLEMQKQELAQNNEELETQSRALKESEGKLQLQQEELRMTNEELEVHAKQLETQKRILNEKNHALAVTQEALMIKAETLERTNKYRSEFLANMSHELRTPLNSILVLSQLLMNKEDNAPLSEKEKVFASTIHSSGDDLLTLINGVLDLSKVEAGKLTIHTEKVYLSQLVLENRNAFESIADLKNVELRFLIEENMPEYIETDGQRLNQIIKNLISNAIKFTHEGEVSVQFRNVNDFESNQLSILKEDYIAIEIKDTGIGIPSDKMQEIFEAFKQVDGTISRQYGGTGLGLTISLELAKLLEGHILHSSMVDQGSQFSILLPRTQSVVKKRLDALDLAGAPELSPTSPIDKEKCLLIISDNIDVAKIISGLAQERGYQVAIAETGEEGLSKAKEILPIGIILNMDLPDMDGFVVAKTLSKDDLTKEIPVHMISSFKDCVERSDIDEMPQNIIGFFKKSIDVKAIYRMISKIESISVKGTKQILVVGNCGDEHFDQFIQLGQFEMRKVLTASEATQALESQFYDGIILDIKLSDLSGIEFMKVIREDLLNQTPIIIYTDEEIALDEIDEINRYAETIILKSQKSKDRLVDEIALFLLDINKPHVVEQTKTHETKMDKNTGLGVCVLLADDDSRNVFSLTHLLEYYGINVIVAKDGIEAVKKFEENEVDLILMDIMMPKMDGYEAMKQIRLHPKGTKIPMIALTAKAMSRDRDKCIEAGANDYLIKPVDAQKLISIIKVWLS